MVVALTGKGHGQAAGCAVEQLRSNRFFTGQVVVDVTVDASGRVTYASYRAQGSTTNSKRLVDAAVEAARKARVSSSESLMQTGTITYVFTLN